MTAQFAEALFHVGKYHRLCTLPLESYLDVSQKRALFTGLYANTACTRRYVGAWEIVDGRLFLIKLHMWGEADFPLDVLFPQQQEPIFAHWFTGILRCPKGALLKYVHFDFRSIYERDWLIYIKEGMVEGERVVINPPPPPRDSRELDDIPEFLKKR